MQRWMTGLVGWLWLTGAAQAAPAAVDPSAASWRSPPNLPGLSAAWLIGSEAAIGPYALRVKLQPHSQIPAHSHPDSRITTVLSGTLQVAMATTDGAEAVFSVPAGSVYLAPAGVQHRVWSEAQAVEYQETGTGPTANLFAPAPQAP